jgi:hypothetical protein
MGQRRVNSRRGVAVVCATLRRAAQPIALSRVSERSSMKIKQANGFETRFRQYYGKNPKYYVN